MTNDIKISRSLAERLTKDYTGRPNWDALEEDRLAATEELRAILAAPAVERQEPVGFRYRAHGGHWEWMDESPFADGREHYKLGGEELQPLYTSPPAPVSVVLPRYTCIGKGGDYERLGYAKPSGALRTIQGESGVIVYRDTASGQLYFRDPADFQQRMACLDKVKEMNE